MTCTSTSHFKSISDGPNDLFVRVNYLSQAIKLSKLYNTGVLEDLRLGNVH